ncbi:hypothetical protein D9M70_330740 [compost metagenome]
MHHRVQVAQPLRQLEATPEQRVVAAEDLRHAARPAHALADVQAQALGGQAGRQGDRNEGGVPALALQLERGVGVLGDGFHREAVGLLQRAAADDGTGAAEERRVPVVVALLHRPIEQLALVGHLTTGRQVALERVRRIEMVRRLHQGQLRVLDEPADCGLQEGPGADVVAIEDADQLAMGATERVVEIARLGVGVVRTGDVTDPGRRSEGAELGTTAVVEHIDAQLVRRIVDVLRGEDGVLDHVQAFVVGRDIDVDRRPGAVVRRQRADLPLDRPDALDVAKQQDQPGIELGQVQAHAEHRFQAIAEGQRLGGAPIQVARRHGHRDHHQRQGHRTRLDAVEQQHQQDAGRRQQELHLRIHRHHDDQQQNRHRQRDSQACREPAHPGQGVVLIHVRRS